MSDFAVWPAVNASLNALAGLFLLTGWAFIMKGRRESHRRAMIAACAASLVFLVSYVFYHYNVGSTKFAGTGWSRPVYFSILISHTVLAVAILPLVLMTLWNAFTNRLAAHRRIARWTFPLWIYVSFTGVVVYLFLYHFFER